MAGTHWRQGCFCLFDLRDNDVAVDVARRASVPALPSQCKLYTLITGKGRWRGRKRGMEGGRESKREGWKEGQKVRERDGRRERK